VSIPTFPALIGLSYPVGRAPAWRTIKQEAISGKETRLQLWTYPRYHYEIPVSYLGSGSPGQNQDWQILMGFFNSVAGSALPFHWNDPYDNQVLNQPIGTGDGATTSFDFIRPLGGFAEPVQDANPGSVSVSVNGTGTTAYTLLTDANWGLTYGLRFTAAPASGAAITASFSYDWPCRFDEDMAGFSNFMSNFWELKKIAFTTLKVL
jgi:uncharacterized protein (TIGR02217 family)